MKTVVHIIINTFPERFKLFCALFSYSLLLVLSANSYADKSKGTKQEIEELRQSLNQKQATLNKEQKALKETEVKLSNIYADIASLKDSLALLNQEKKGLEAQKYDISKKLDTQLDYLSSELNALYHIGQSASIKQLLENNKEYNHIRMQSYYKYWLSARSKNIDEHHSFMKKLELTEREILDKTVELSQKQNTLANKKLELDDQKSKRKDVVTKIKSQVSSQQAQIRQLEENLRALESIVSQITKKNSSIAQKKPTPKIKEEPSTKKTQTSNKPIIRKPDLSFAKRKGYMSWPTKGERIANFGDYRPNSRIKWNGVVIASKTGNNVRAVHRGEVVFADWLRGFGLLIILQHENGYVSLYGYNQYLTKDIGDYVDAGEVISKVGSSGGQNKPSLYFEIRKNSEPQNPKYWCR